MSEHTPGPWTVSENEGSDGTVRIYAWNPTDATDCTPVAECEGRANAILIASAPTLAAELKEARRLLAGFMDAMNQACAYTGSVGCDMLPEGVKRSPCFVCQARAFLARGGE